jgi:hypothetical protein
LVVLFQNLGNKWESGEHYIDEKVEIFLSSLSDVAIFEIVKQPHEG